MKCFVVKTDRQKLAHSIDDLCPVPHQPAERVDRSQIRSGPKRSHVAANIRSTTILEHRVHVVISQAVDAASSMVFEAAPQQSHAVGGKRAADRVARKADVFLSLELKLQRLRAVDPLTRLLRKALGHCWSLA